MDIYELSKSLMKERDMYKEAFEQKCAEVNRLAAERDAAVADLKELGLSEGVVCGNCKHFFENNPIVCKECTTENDRVNWEWCGLSLDFETSDKQPPREVE